MQTVISVEQARKITGGRTPLVPVEYESAVTALQACITIDETKYWSDKADALAAWAKIYRNDDIGRKARQLKLHAFRRMGALAGELSPTKNNVDGKGGRSGPVAYLKKQGMSQTNARAARQLSLTEQSRFDSLVARPRPPSPTTALSFIADVTESWQAIRHPLAQMRSIVKAERSAREVARALSKDEAAKAREVTREIIEWLDEFEQHLPK
jgi:hypothetical protein